MNDICSELTLLTASHLVMLNIALPRLDAHTHAMSRQVTATHSYCTFSLQMAFNLDLNFMPHTCILAHDTHSLTRTTPMYSRANKVCGRYYQILLC
jgi:hypothetical protein